MLKEGLKYLVELGQKDVVINSKNGGEYTPTRIERIECPRAQAFTVRTLTSAVDYIKSKADKLPDEIIVQVVSPERVFIMGPLNEDREREKFLSVEALLPNVEYGKFIDVEKFNIMMQSAFTDYSCLGVIDGEEIEICYKKILLQVVGNVRQEAVGTIGDDGVTQTATIKTGVATVEPIVVPNPVILAPYRTFQEVDQPASKFIFRMQDGPKAALFEADGGAWRNEAMKNIKNFLEEELKEIEGIHILA